jgi:hypothetical protein
MGNPFLSDFILLIVFVAAIAAFFLAAKAYQQSKRALLSTMPEYIEDDKFPILISVHNRMDAEIENIQLFDAGNNVYDFNAPWKYDILSGVPQLTYKDILRKLLTKEFFINGILIGREIEGKLVRHSQVLSDQPPLAITVCDISGAAIYLPLEIRQRATHAHDRLQMEAVNRFDQFPIMNADFTFVIRKMKPKESLYFRFEVSHIK